VNNELAI